MNETSRPGGGPPRASRRVAGVGEGLVSVLHYVVPSSVVRAVFLRLPSRWQEPLWRRVAEKAKREHEAARR